MLTLASRFGAYTLALRVLLAAVVLCAAGCATAPGRTSGDDPWNGLNRGVYKFNDGVDRAVVKPTAKAYKKVTPNWLRGSISRFFANLDYPATMLNQLLQGKPKLFFQDTGRFLTNTTLGLGGLFDVADKLGMPAHDEDFGQTLAVWGVPSGPYFMLPVLGPSTVRDATGRIPDFFVVGLGFVDKPSWVDWSARGLDLVDTRAELLTTETAIEDAYDRYGVVRDAWIQRRVFNVYDGEPPEEPLEMFDQETDEPDAAPTPDN